MLQFLLAIIQLVSPSIKSTQVVQRIGNVQPPMWSTCRLLPSQVSKRLQDPNFSFFDMIKNNLICRKIYYNLRKKKKQIRLNLSSTRGGRKDKNADDDADSWVDVTSDPESDQEKMEDSNDNEESKDYRVGGYHPVNIGDLYEQRYFVIRKLGT